MVQAMQIQNIKVEVNKLPMTMYLVNLDNETENIIHLLKAAYMRRRFTDAEGTERQITYKQVLKHVAKFNEETDKKLRASFPENVGTRRTPPLGLLREKKLFPYCEHPELSCCAFATPYHSLHIPDYMEICPNETV